MKTNGKKHLSRETKECAVMLSLLTLFAIGLFFWTRAIPPLPEGTSPHPAMIGMAYMIGGIIIFMVMSLVIALPALIWGPRAVGRSNVGIDWQNIIVWGWIVALGAFAGFLMIREWLFWR